MKQWLKEHFANHLIRPTIYKTFTRFIYALTLTLLWKRFSHDWSAIAHRSYAFVFLGMLFLAFAWMNYLWLDGLRSPFALKGQLAQLQQMLKKRRSIAFSISDHVDTEIISFDELTENERCTCSLVANLICGLLFLLWSMV